MSDLAYISATEALTLFRERKLSPVEVLDAIQLRAEEVEPVVNSLCHVNFDAARAAAKKAEARYSGKGPGPRPLEGLLVAIKEDEAIAGEPWTQGSLVLRDEIADHTEDVPQRVLDSGGIVHARTTMPELGSAGFTRSRLWGTTRNPWNPDQSAGGSSGGSAAALAAGVTTLATGSDIGGSIRIPASFNGIVGYKPPFGRVPLDPPSNFDTFFHVGPMARTVRDTALLQNILAGPSQRDINTLRPKYVLPDTLEDVRGLRIALSVDLGSYPVDPEVRKNTLDIAAALRDAGATVEEVDLTLSRDTIHRIASIHYLIQGGDMMREYAKSDLVSPYMPVVVERFDRYGAGGSIAEMNELKAELYVKVAALFESYDALITPTMATRGMKADSDYLGDEPFFIDGEEFNDPMFGVMTIAWNIMSQCPVLSVPSGFADNGLPTGVQIVGPTYTDEVVFRIGAAIENHVSLYGDSSVRPSPAPR
ncbi:amidase [Arthrobacter sp. CDRTa11]|uniref:amidase n=1 Tax=Arthrobacter sp. CDRTa11 TaxID=2651199 RepID=UPI002265CEF6|nr:amidase [Arthrobacter sp. CDRTa11]UZX02859.1 amidase [Arthrobacter sp. CDRTa11]